MDKQKQIEEMAKAMLEFGMEKYPTGESVFTETKLREQFYHVFLTYAEYLINAGYRKIPENAVVLTREEHQRYLAYKIIEPQIRGCLDREEKLEKQVRELGKELNLAKSVLSYDDERPLEKWAEHLRKETVDKFAERLKLMLKELGLGGWIEVATGSMYEIVDEIAKELGVGNG